MCILIVDCLHAQMSLENSFNPSFQESGPMMRFVGPIQERIEWNNGKKLLVQTFESWDLRERAKRSPKLSLDGFSLSFTYL